MNPRPEISYFDIRGRAEPIRLLLEEVGVEYDDRQLSSEQWAELKPTLPFGQLPLFRQGDLEMVQSHAIFRHLARIHDLCGQDEAQRRRCDMVIEAIRDADEQLGGLFWRPDFERQRESFRENELPARLGGLVRFLDANPGAPQFWAGGSLTLADIFAFAFLEDCEALLPGSLADTESLAQFRQRFSQRPRIAAYLISARRPAAIMYGPAGKIHPVASDPSAASDRPTERAT